MILLVGVAAAWTLQGDWSPADRARVDTLRAALPAEWRAVPLELERAATTTMHTPREGRLAVEEDLEGSIVHGLAHILDARHGWSVRTEFRALSGWGPWPYAGGPAELDPLAFAAPAGRTSPAEDLATTAALVVAGAPDRRCDLPSKWRYVAHLLDRPAPAPCTTLAEVGLDPEAIAEIDLVYVVAAGQAASLAGHMLVVLRMHPGADGIAAEEAYGLVAETGDVPEGTPEYMLRGLGGGFVSRIVREPLDAAILRYAELEDRDLRFYRLVLDAAAKARLLARLDELRLGWQRPYLFLTRNCVQLPVELATAAWGEPVDGPAVLTPDTLLAGLARRGRVEALPADRVAQRGVGTRALAATRLRAEQERRWRVRWSDLGPALRGIHTARPDTRASGYTALATLLQARAGDELRRYLGWSDVVEQARLARARRRGPGDPAVIAIRAALGTMERPTVATTGMPELRAALHDEPARGSTHTPSQPWVVTGYALQDATGLTPAIALRTALYDGELGPGRRFVLSETMAVTALREELRLAWPIERTTSRTTVWHSVYAPRTASGVGPGLGLTLGDLAYGAGRIGGTWLGVDALGVARGGPLVARVGVGLSVRSVDAPWATLRPALGAPISGELALTSARTQRTGVRLAGAVIPTLDTAGAWTLDWRARGAFGLHVVEIADTDLGLELVGAADPRGRELGLGVSIERF